jgi:hypothetical protein
MAWWIEPQLTMSRELNLKLERFLAHKPFTGEIQHKDLWHSLGP